jgi:diguanylate cyclase
MRMRTDARAHARRGPRDRQGEAVQAGKLHWVVTLNHRNRSLFFALGLPVLGTHLAYLQAGPLMWTLLALQLLAYPQLVYWRARRAADPLRAELGNLLLDGFLMGIWIAAWGLPLWISFMFFVGVCLNVVIFMGMPGLWKGIAALAAGVVAVALVNGLEFRPETALHTSLLCIALLTGYLLFFANDAYRRGVSLRESRRKLGEQLAQITGLQARLQEQAQRDPLTGLHNRRFLDEALERQLEACAQTGTPLTLVLIDIDRFKRINDTYGHPAGDEVIRRLADLLRERVRDAGLIACRYGGEEFLMMLPGMRVDEALAMAEDLRSTFESLEVVSAGQTMRTTLSIGVAGCPEHGTQAQPLVLRADQALYEAKLRGRNRVVRASDGRAATRAGGEPD